MSNSSHEIRVCSVAELADIPMKRFDVLGRGVLISRVGQKYYATTDTCSHQEVLLDTGELEGTLLTCGAHGAKFDVTTGAVKGLPAMRPLVSYPLRVRNAELFIIVPAE
jgi:3-phenylpropionate/trans-cinnamate dioxygenase ferredoxin subunit